MSEVRVSVTSRCTCAGVSLSSRTPPITGLTYRSASPSYKVSVRGRVPPKPLMSESHTSSHCPTVSAGARRSIPRSCAVRRVSVSGAPRAQCGRTRPCGGGALPPRPGRASRPRALSLARLKTAPSLLTRRRFAAIRPLPHRATQRLEVSSLAAPAAPALDRYSPPTSVRRARTHVHRQSPAHSLRDDPPPPKSTAPYRASTGGLVSRINSQITPRSPRSPRGLPNLAV